MQYTPSISVIIACYNSAKTLPQCLKSLAKNLINFKPGTVEVLAPYRSSQDDTLYILEGDKNIKVIEDTKGGVANAHNLGVRHATGRYGVFLNSDDELSENFLPVVLECVQSSQNPDRHVVYTSVKFIDSESKCLYCRHPAPYVGWIQRWYSIIMHPNAIYPMGLLKAYPFEVVAGNPARDREQVYKLMKHATSSRTRSTSYNFRIWPSSSTVRASKEAHPRNAATVVVTVLGRLYVQAYETKLASRVIKKCVGKGSPWTNPR